MKNEEQLPEQPIPKRLPTDWTSIAVTIDTHDYIDGEGIKLNKAERGKRWESHNDTIRRKLGLDPQINNKEK